MRKKNLRTLETKEIIYRNNFYDNFICNTPMLVIPYKTKLPFFVKAVRSGDGSYVFMLNILLFVLLCVSYSVNNTGIVTIGTELFLFVLCFCEVLDSIYCQVQKKYDDDYDLGTTCDYLAFCSHGGFFIAALVFFITNLAFPCVLPDCSLKAKIMGLIGITVFFVIFDIILRKYSKAKKKEHDFLNQFFIMRDSEYEKKRDRLLKKNPKLDHELKVVFDKLENLRDDAKKPKKGYFNFLTPEEIAVIQAIVSPY